MYARKDGTAWEIDAPAKLNLYLDVLGRRADGFHELETLMAPVQLSDRLQWHPSNNTGAREFSLRIDAGASPAIARDMPADQRNLVWKAVDALGRQAGVEPHGVITLTKRIPSQAGLGGGSSDAAAALLLANAAWGINYPVARLRSLAAELGSDVPFFLAGSSAVCRGRGEIVEPVVSLPRLDVVIVAPRDGVPTAAAFKMLNAPPLDARGGTHGVERSTLLELVCELKKGAIASAGRLMANSLHAVARTLCPAVERIGTHFARIACCAHMLTGSGSAYFGLMNSACQARRAAALLSSHDLGTVFATATCR